MPEPTQLEIPGALSGDGENVSGAPDIVKFCAKQWYKDKKIAGLCISCGVQPTNGVTRCSECRNKFNLRRLQNKIDAINTYGVVCQCCGENNIHFLTIDHVNNDGAAHRKKIGNSGGSSFYSWIKKQGYPSGFQTMCFNCNMSKGFLGVCAHKLGEP